MSVPAGRPLSILLVSHSYPPVMGGSEAEAQRTAAELIRRGHRVVVACAANEPMPPVERWTDPEGVPVRIYGRGWSRGMLDIVFALRVAWQILTGRREYDVVYFLMQGLQLLIGLPLARLLGKAVVVKISGSNVIRWIAGMRLGRIELWMTRRWAYRLMILNDGMREEALEQGFAPEQLLWMPNPVDTNRFAPVSAPERARIRKQLGFQADTPLILFSGRLIPVKALPFLFDAMAEVARRVPNAVLALIGDGPEQPKLQAQAERLGIGNNVRFVGRVPASAVPSWLQIADVFALVSISEGFSCALTEAMSCGAASVVTDIPANRQLVTDGEHGLLVPYGDSKAIAAALAELLLDPARRARMGMAARSLVVEKYGTEQVGDRYESLMTAAVGSA